MRNKHLAQFELSFFIVIFLSILTACTPGPIKKTQTLAKDLDAKGLLHHHQFEIDGEELYYVERDDNESSDTAILWLHGTPGAWTVFSPQFSDEQLSQHFKLVAIDRPTWGQSSLGSAYLKQSSQSVLDLSSQLDLLEPFINHLSENHAKLVVAGHSLGGTMAPMLALRFSDQVDAAISIAGDLSSDLLDPFWYNRLADTWLANVLLPKELTTANKEVLSLPKSLRVLKSNFKYLDVPFLVIHGVEDVLVDVGNVDFAHQLKTKNRVVVKAFEKEGHLLHVGRSEDINRLIKDFVLTL